MVLRASTTVQKDRTPQTSAHSSCLSTGFERMVTSVGLPRALHWFHEIINPLFKWTLPIPCSFQCFQGKILLKWSPFLLRTFQWSIHRYVNPWVNSTQQKLWVTCWLAPGLAPFFVLKSWAWMMQCYGTPTSKKYCRHSSPYNDWSKQLVETLAARGPTG